MSSELTNIEIKNIYNNYLAELSYWSQLDNCYKKIDNDLGSKYIAGLTTLFITKLGISLDELVSNLTALYHCMFIEADYFPAEYTVPDNIELIDWTPFYQVNNLKKLTVPDTVKNVTRPIAINCDNLTKIVLPACVTDICEEGVEDCKNLKTIVISPNCKKIVITGKQIGLALDVVYYIQSPNTQVEVQVQGNWRDEDEKNEWTNKHIVVTY